MTVAQAKDYFISTVCPVATEIKVIDNLPRAAGGWPKVHITQAAPYISSLEAEASKAAGKLTAANVVWPTNVSASIPGVQQAMLAMLVPLGQMAKAPNGASMAAPWQRVSLDPRTAEQQVRLTLGLGAANSANDGCPPVPLASPPVVVTPTPTPAPTHEANPNSALAYLNGTYNGTMVLDPSKGTDVLYTRVVIDNGEATVSWWTANHGDAQNPSAEYVASVDAGSNNPQDVAIVGTRWISKQDPSWTMDDMTLNFNNYAGTLNGVYNDQGGPGFGTVSLQRS